MLTLLAKKAGIACKPRTSRVGWARSSIAGRRTDRPAIDTSSEYERPASRSTWLSRGEGAGSRARHDSGLADVSSCLVSPRARGCGRSRKLAACRIGSAILPPLRPLTLASADPPDRPADLYLPRRGAAA